MLMSIAYVLNSANKVKKINPFFTGKIDTQENEIKLCCLGKTLMIMRS